MKSTQNRKQTSWTCTGAIGKSTGCTCRCHHRIAGKIQLCEAGGKIDYLLCISLAQQLLPFGLLECDSGSWFNCDLHLKYRSHTKLHPHSSDHMCIDPHSSGWSLMHQFTLKFSFDVTVNKYMYV